MGSPAINPAALQALRLKAAQAQSGQGAMGAAAPPPGGSPQAQANQMLSQLRVASPDQAKQMISQIRRLMVSMQAKFLDTVPGFARYVGPALKAFDGMMTELGKAQQTVSAAGPPIGLGTASTPGASPGPMPGSMGRL
jgi:hypothetical protein